MGGTIEKVVLIAVVGLIVYSLVGMFKTDLGGSGGGRNGGPLQGQSAPDFQLASLDGERTWNMQDLRGKVVVLSFWASWCPPCRAELPGLNTLHTELADQGLVVLAVNSQDNPKNARDFVKSSGFTMPVAIDTEGTVTRDYEVPGFPTLFIIGRDGIVDFSQAGYRKGQEADIKKRVETLLEAPEPADVPSRTLPEPDTALAP